MRPTWIETAVSGGRYHSDDGPPVFKETVRGWEREDVPGLAVFDADGWWSVTHAPSGYMVVRCFDLFDAYDAIGELGAATDWSQSKEVVEVAGKAAGIDEIVDRWMRRRLQRIADEERES